MKFIGVILLIVVSKTILGQSSDEYVNSAPDPKSFVQFNKVTSKKGAYTIRLVRRNILIHISRHLEYEKKMLNQICHVNDKHSESLYRASDFAYTQLCRKMHMAINQPLSDGNSQFQQMVDVINRMTKLVQDSALTANSELDKSESHGLSVAQNMSLLHVEFKRAEDVSNYLKSRTEYWTRLIKRYPFIFKECKRMDLNSDLFKNRINVYRDIFLSHSKFEKRFINQINQCAMDQVPDIPSPSSVKSAANLSMEELLKAKGENSTIKPNIPKKGSVMDENIINGSSIPGLDSLPKASNLMNTREEVETEMETDSIVDLGTKDSKLKAKRHRDRISSSIQLSPSNYWNSMPLGTGAHLRLCYQGTEKLAMGITASKNFLILRSTQSEKTNTSNLRPWKFGGVISLDITPRIAAVGLFETSWFLRSSLLEKPSELTPANSTQMSELLGGIKFNQRGNRCFRTSIELLFRCDFKTEISSQNIVLRMGFDLNSKHFNS